jgi:hypothetical protein
MPLKTGLITGADQRITCLYVFLFRSMGIDILINYAKKKFFFLLTNFSK